MNQYTTLLGAEEVSRAGYVMRDAATEMRRAASQLAEALDRHRIFLEEWLRQFEQIIHEVKP